MGLFTHMHLLGQGGQTTGSQLHGGEAALTGGEHRAERNVEGVFSSGRHDLQDNWVRGGR